MRIIATATYLPEHHYETKDLLSKLSIQLPDETLQSIGRLNVHSRNFAYPISTIIDGSFRAKYPDRSFQLAKMAGAKVGTVDKIGLLIACCNAHDYICPNLSSMLLRSLELPPQTRHCTLQGLGCTSYIVALQMAEDYLSKHRDKQVLIITSEVNSMLFANDLRKILEQPELRQGSRGWVTLIETMLFGDGAAATLVSADEAGDRIYPLLHVTNLNPQDYKLGMVESNFYLSSEIPAAGVRYTKFILEQLQLNPRSFSKIILHTGSRRIIDSLLSTLECMSEAAGESYKILESYGNLSGASLQFILKEVLDSNNSGSGLMLGFGLGFHAGAARIEF